MGTDWICLAGVNAITFADCPRLNGQEIKRDEIVSTSYVSFLFCFDR